MTGYGTEVRISVKAAADPRWMASQARETRNMTMLGLLILAVALLVVDLLANRYGADSRVRDNRRWMI